MTDDRRHWPVRPEMSLVDAARHVLATPILSVPGMSVVVDERMPENMVAFVRTRSVTRDPGEVVGVLRMSPQRDSYVVVSDRRTLDRVSAIARALREAGEAARQQVRDGVTSAFRWYGGPWPYGAEPGAVPPLPEMTDPTEASRG